MDFSSSSSSSETVEPTPFLASLKDIDERCTLQGSLTHSDDDVSLKTVLKAIPGLPDPVLPIHVEALWSYILSDETVEKEKEKEKEPETKLTIFSFEEEEEEEEKSSEKPEETQPPFSLQLSFDAESEATTLPPFTLSPPPIEPSVTTTLDNAATIPLSSFEENPMSSKPSSPSSSPSASNLVEMVEQMQYMVTQLFQYAKQEETTRKRKRGFQYDCVLNKKEKVSV